MKVNLTEELVTYHPKRVSKIIDKYFGEKLYSMVFEAISDFEGECLGEIEIILTEKQFNKLVEMIESIRR